MRNCPVSGAACSCVDGCQAFDVQVEAVTVVHTSIRGRAAARLVASTAAPARAQPADVALVPGLLSFGTVKG